MSETNWNDLARRCEEATGADREIDAAIFLALGWTYEKRERDRHPYYREPKGANAYRYTTDRWSTAAKQLPELTASLDAITALIERELPGWMARVQWCGLSAEAWVAPDLNNPLCAPEIRADQARWHDYAERNEVEVRPGSRQAATLALCAAFCRAMAHRSTPHE